MSNELNEATTSENQDTQERALRIVFVGHVDHGKSITHRWRESRGP